MATYCQGLLCFICVYGFNMVSAKNSSITNATSEQDIETGSDTRISCDIFRQGKEERIISEKQEGYEKADLNRDGLISTEECLNYQNTVDCCPATTHCDVSQWSCTEGNTLDIYGLVKVPAITARSTDNVLSGVGFLKCKDGKHKCKHGQTCCLKPDRSSYGCCPISQAECCSDGKHCCPQGTFCTASGKCTKRIKP